jgi:hypothetical protein
MNKRATSISARAPWLVLVCTGALAVLPTASARAAPAAYAPDRVIVKYAAAPARGGGGAGERE